LASASAWWCIGALSSERWRGAKKNGSEQAPAEAPDARALAECYEALRKGVVESNRCVHTLRGRALLMFKGMAVWMKCMGEVAWRGPSPDAPRNESPLPVGIEQNLVDIMATMVFANAMEDRA
jgi:hypothetical protein